MKRSCDRCEFSVPMPETKRWVQCHRNPPYATFHVELPVSERIITFFPETHVSAWCGEFKAKQEGGK